MSEVTSWFGTVAVTGLGMVTPVGLTAPASLASLRARISRIGDLPSFQVPNASGEMQPATGAEVPIIPGNRQGPARLIRLAECALREAVTEARLSRGQRCALYLGTAAPHPAGRVLPYAQILSEELGGVIAGLVGAATVYLFEAGRASALQAIRKAASALTLEKSPPEESPPEVVIVGGVDSLISPLTLSFLKANGRLREGGKSTGILPGEGAGFLVLEKPENAVRRGAKVIAYIEAAAGGVDSTPVEKPTRAVVLGHVLRAVSAKVKDDPAPIIISDLNGERQRAYEWMFASVRAPFYHSGTPHWRPSESIGDAGAASGAVASAWAVAALCQSYTRADQAVVWGASDEGAREALILQRANGVN